MGGNYSYYAALVLEGCLTESAQPFGTWAPRVLLFCILIFCKPLPSHVQDQTLTHAGPRWEAGLVCSTCIRISCTCIPWHVCAVPTACCCAPKQLTMLCTQMTGPAVSLAVPTVFACGTLLHRTLGRGMACKHPKGRNSIGARRAWLTHPQVSWC